MSESNQRGATTPSNLSAIIPWNGTVALATDAKVAEGSGQSTNSASAPQAMRTSIHAGQQQAAGGSSNAARQNRNQRAPGNGRGRGKALPSSSTRCATSARPSVGGEDRGTQNAFGSNRGSDSIADAFNQANSRTRATQATMIPRHELSVQSNTLNEVISMEPKDKSMPRTNFVTQSGTCMMGIDVKMSPDTQEGWETMLEAAKVIRQRCGGRDILWTAIPLQNEDADKATGANAFPVAQQDDNCATPQWMSITGAHTAGQVAPRYSEATSNELLQSVTGANTARSAASEDNTSSANAALQRITGANTARQAAPGPSKITSNEMLRDVTGANTGHWYRSHDG